MSSAHVMARSGVAGRPFASGSWRRLWQTCLAALPRFYDSGSGILVKSLSHDGASWTANGTSAANTAIAAVTLFSLDHAGTAPPIDPRALVDRLVASHLRELDYSATACLLWADSLGERRHERVLWDALQSRMSKDASQTLYLAWLVVALCHYHGAGHNREEARRLIERAYARITANQSAGGLFHGSAAREGWLRRRRPISTLSSQTYPIYALALYGRVFGVTEAVARAKRCADAVCRLQGPQGQWWWRSNVRTGAVVERHPVYAINQDTAIPLAFHELQRSTLDRAYEPFITRGLEWLFGANELGVSLVDEAQGVIWRAIRAGDGGFSIERAMHSYHPARCLFAMLAAGPVCVGDPALVAPEAAG